MPFATYKEIEYFQFGIFDTVVCHAIFTRRGGISPEPWASLNMGSSVGDVKDRVHENRNRALAALKRDPASIFDVWQVHGRDVAFAESPRKPDTPHLQADVILTNKPGVTLMMRFADCVPILLHDPIRNVVGMIHAGWAGTVLGTARNAVEAMHRHYDSNPVDIKAAIGPSIGPDHYEVGPDVFSQIQHSFGKVTQDLIHDQNGHTFFDMWKANQMLLEQSGVRQIEVSGLCTACHIEDWYSHRAEKGRTGRFGALISFGK
jgi:polyphenol oxidase